MTALVQPAPIPARHELKYAVPEALTPAIREAIRPFCDLDPNSAAAPGHRYVIRSLYLDTWSRDLYRLTCERRPRRLKLRVRTYGDAPEAGQVFLEVKRREHGLVRKSRARVQGPGWAERLRGPTPADATDAERAFRHELFRLGLAPTLLVRYEREAWVGTVDRYARVTFDRRVVCAPTPRWTLAAGGSEWLAVDERRFLKGQPLGTVLELKCERAVPRWIVQLVRRFGLRRIGISKYCRSVERAWQPEGLAWDRAATREGKHHG